MKLKHLFQAYHVVWMLIAILAIAFGLEALFRGDPAALRRVGGVATVLAGYYAYSTANRRRRGEWVGPIQAAMEGRAPAPGSEGRSDG